MTRHGTTLFCDDIREEADGRLSVMGVYTEALWVPSFPFTLRRLGVVTILETPVSRPFGTASLRISLPGHTDTIEEDVLAGVGAPSTRRIDQARAADADLVEAARLRLASNLVLTDLVLQESGFIRVRGVCDGEMLGCGALRVASETV